MAGTATAKVPGLVHCYNEICHRVRTVDETDGRRGHIEPVIASFYDWPANDRFNPSTETSSGAQFDADAPDNAASPIHPDGTVLLVWSPVTRGAAVVRVNNAGPYYPGRTLDVSRGVAEKLGFARGGVMQLLSMVISAPSEPDARYRRGRIYPKVSGYLGTFDNLALASLEDPIARDAVFKGSQPLPALALNLALNTSQQLMLNATEAHMKAQAQGQALAASFATVPNDMVEPPELHVSMIEAEGEVVAPDVAILAHVLVAAVEPPKVLEPIIRVVTASYAQAGLTAFAPLAVATSLAEDVRAKVQKKIVAESEKSEPVVRARLQARPVRVAEERSNVTFSRTAGRTWFDGDTPDVGR